MKIFTKAQAIADGWSFINDDVHTAEKLFTDPYPHFRKEFGKDAADLLQRISEFEARAASDEHHANLY